MNHYPLSYEGTSGVLGTECNKYMKNLDIVKEAAFETRRTFFAILNSGVCEMERHPFPLLMRKIYQTFVLPRAPYSWSKGALSVNFRSIAIELNVPRDDFSSIELLSPWDTVFKKAGSVLFDICAPGTRTF